MKTISREGEILRVDDATAEAKVRAGWNYTTKKVWKEKVRDPHLRELAEEEKRKQEEKNKRILEAKQDQQEQTIAQKQLRAKKNNKK